MKMISFAAGVAALAFSGAALAQDGGRQGDRPDMTRAEVAAKAEKRFARLDLNSDGRLTRQEMQQARQQHAAKRAERRAKRGLAEDPRRAERRERRQARVERGGGMFGADGVVTLAAFRDRALVRFDRRDADSNGIVTAAERQQRRQERRNNGQ